jgi:hypothetical protein
LFYCLIYTHAISGGPTPRSPHLFLSRRL